jgi:phytoene desaturase
MTRIVVIGAGMGGLATALRLAQRGFQVTVVEKQPRPGGRSNLLQEAGFRADTGPTILVMKAAFEELYHSIGQNLSQRLHLVQLDPNYRIYYHDGSYIDLYSNMAQLAQEVEKVLPGSSERLFRFIGDSAKKYELGMEFVERNYDHVTDMANPKAGWRLWQTKAHQNLYKQVAAYFEHNDKLAKAFSFHSMFLGLSPFDALAMYSLITYADLALGMWFPMGGIYSIIEDMLRLGKQMGVELRTNSPVEKICIENRKVTGCTPCQRLRAAG